MFSEKVSKLLVYIGLGILLLGGLFFMYNELNSLSFNEKINSEKVAQFGDFIGGLVGALWSLAGFILIYLAFLKQSEALENQKKATDATVEAVQTQGRSLEIQSTELALQRQELEETRAVFEEQSLTMKLERFESTFFNLITLLNDVVKRIIFYDYVGKSALNKIYEDLGNRYNTISDFHVDESDLDNINEAFMEIFENNKEDLRHYFNTCFQIYRLIDRSNINNKIVYSDIFRSQLSTAELGLSYYLNLSNMKRQSYIDFLNRFDVYRRFEDSDLLDPNHKTYYPADFFTIKN